MALPFFVVDKMPATTEASFCMETIHVRYNPLMKNSSMPGVCSKSNNFFFLESAGELRIIILRKERSKMDRNYNTKTKPSSLPHKGKPDGPYETLFKATIIPKLSKCFAPALLQLINSSRNNLFVKLMEGLTPSKTTLLRESHKHQAPRIMTLLKPLLLHLWTLLETLSHHATKD
jgi:hypothetical protein